MGWMKDGSCVLQPGILCAEFKRICNDYECGLDVITGVSSPVVSWKSRMTAVQSWQRSWKVFSLRAAAAACRRSARDQRSKAGNPETVILDSFDPHDQLHRRHSHSLGGFGALQFGRTERDVAQVIKHPRRAVRVDPKDTRPQHPMWRLFATNSNKRNTASTQQYHDQVETQGSTREYDGGLRPLAKQQSQWSTCRRCCSSPSKSPAKAAHETIFYGRWSRTGQFCTAPKTGICRSIR